MGMDVYIIPLEKEVTFDRVKEDENLLIKENNGTILISLASNTDSTILMYTKEDIVGYVRVFRDSAKILKYLAETYNTLIAGDGFMHDAGYASMMDSAYCDSEEEARALTLGYSIDEMLDYDGEYQWSDDFRQKLEKLMEEIKPCYDEVVKKVDARLKEEMHKRHEEYMSSPKEQVNETFDEDDGLPF